MSLNDSPRVRVFVETFLRNLLPHLIGFLLEGLWECFHKQVQTLEKFQISAPLVRGLSKVIDKREVSLGGQIPDVFNFLSQSLLTVLCCRFSIGYLKKCIFNHPSRRRRTDPKMLL